MAIMDKFRRLFRNPKLVSIGCSGTGQLLMFGSMALVSRTFSPAQIGEYGVFFAIFNISQILIMLRLEQGIVYTRNENGISALATASLIAIPLSLCVFVPIAYYFLSTNPQTADHTLLLVVSLVAASVCGGVTRLVNQLIARRDAFLWLAVLNFFRPGLIALFQGISAFMGSVHGDLSVSFAFSQVFLLVLTYLAYKSLKGTSAELTSLREAKAAVRENRDFVLYNFPQNMLFVMSESILPLALPFLFHQKDTLAFYWLASRVVFAPATVVAESIRPQIYRAIARIEGPIYPYVFKVSASLAVALALPLSVLLLGGEKLFIFAFGPGWGPANDYALILSLLALVNIAMLPFVGALPMLRIQNLLLITEVLGLVTRAIIVFGFSWQTPYESVAFSTLGYVALQAIFAISIAVILIKRGKIRHEPQTA